VPFSDGHGEVPGMPLISWNESLSVGVEPLDVQHRGLVAILNELDQAMTEGQGSTVLAGLLERLVDYTRVHFHDEEALLETHGYPELPAHRKEHARLKDQVLELKDEYDAGRKTLSVQTMAFLRDWLRDHIVGSDKRYGAFLHARGVA
jgi:hemerythrin